MKKQTAILLSILFTTANAFAFPSFTKEANAQEAKQVQAVLTQHKAADEAVNTAQKSFTGILLKGRFTEDFLRVKRFHTSNFKVVFYIENKDEQGIGDIAFAVSASEEILKQMEITAFPHFKEQVNGDPYTEINLILQIRITDPITFKETVTQIPNITTVILLDLQKGGFTEEPVTKIKKDGADFNFEALYEEANSCGCDEGACHTD